LGVAGEEASHHLMVVLAPNSQARQSAADHLKAQGIQTSLHYPFLPAFSAFAGKTAEKDEGAQGLAKTRQFCRRVLTLPLHCLLSKDDVRRVVAALCAAAQS